MTRVLKAVRLQYTNASGYFWVPAMIAVSASVVVILIAAIISVDEPIYSGAANAPIWFFATAGIQSVTLTLPFALALGVTRREYSAATLLSAVGAAGSLAIFAMLLGWGEHLTGGWFLGAYVFYLPWFWSQGPLATWLVFTFISVVLFQIAFGYTLVYKRYGMVAMVLMTVALVLALLVPIWLATANKWWPGVWEWILALRPVDVGIGCLGLSLVIAGLGFIALRRYEVR